MARPHATWDPSFYHLCKWARFWKEWRPLPFPPSPPLAVAMSPPPRPIRPLAQGSASPRLAFQVPTESKSGTGGHRDLLLSSGSTTFELIPKPRLSAQMGRYALRALRCTSCSVTVHLPLHCVNCPQLQTLLTLHKNAV